RRLVVEVKSVTLVDDGVALFPDAVTARGARHVDELAALAARPGWEAAVLFVLQREGAREIRAAAELDPRFAERLDAARRAGVRVLGRRCRVSETAVTLGDPVPVG
ncbi:MAG: DNA/RNA nuclease SfsA, partial [Longimicrobiales bacterium]